MKGRVFMMMLPCVHLFKFHQIKCISLSFRKNLWRGVGRWDILDTEYMYKRQLFCTSNYNLNIKICL